MLKVGDQVEVSQYGPCKIKMIYKKQEKDYKGPVYVLKPKKSSFSLQRIVLSESKAEKLGMRRVNFIILLLCFGFLSGCVSSKYYVGEGYEEGKKAYKKGYYIEAAGNFERFLSMNINNPMEEVVLYYLADCYYQKGEKQKSIETYEKIINKFKMGFWVNSAREKISEIEKSD